MIDRQDCLVTGIIIAGVSLPLVFRKIPPNGFYGFRTPRTVSDQNIWYQANWFAGWALLLAALVIEIIASVIPRGGLHDQGAGLSVIMVPVAIAVAASFGYLSRI